MKMSSILHFVVVCSQFPLCLNTNPARQFVVLVIATVVRDERETGGVDGGAEHGGVVIHGLTTLALHSRCLFTFVTRFSSSNVETASFLRFHHLTQRGNELNKTYSNLTRLKERSQLSNLGMQPVDQEMA